MKIVVLTMLLTFAFAAMQIKAQSTPTENPPIERKITVQFRDVSLRAALSEIAEKSQVKFVYSDELLESDYRVSAKVDEKTPPEILDDILDKLPIGYIVQSPSQIVLTKKSTIKEKYGSIQGQVLDANTGEALAGANVEVLETTNGSASNFGGFFNLRLPVGAYDLKISVIGFESVTRQKIPVVAGKKIYLSFRLQPTVLQMQEVEVTSSRNHVPEHMKVEPSVITVRRSQFTATPTVGEPDVFRTLQNLPGVSSPNDYSSELFIRGGNSDQNLIMLDGAVVYNPYHLLGLAGAFNPDIVEQVNLSLGGFSARYGDRLSSVIDVRTKSSAEGTSGYGNFSLMSSKLTLINSPHPKVNWLMSARRTYHDVAAQLFVGKQVPYYFYDLYGKLQLNPDRRNVIYFSAFYSRDQFKYSDDSRHANYEDWDIYPTDSQFIPEDEGYFASQRQFFFWDNLILSGHWLHEFDNDGLFELQFSQSRSPSDLSYQETLTPASNASRRTRLYIESRNQFSEEFENLAVDNSVLDRTIRADWTFNLPAKHTVSFGGGLSSIRLRYFWEQLFNELNQDELALFFDHAPDFFDYQRNLKQYYFYVEDTYAPNRRLILRPGLRLEKRSFNSHWALEPRMNLSYEINGDLTVKAAYGMFHQGIATSLESGYLQFLPLLFPSENDAPLESAHHFITGFQWNTDKWQLSAEAYYKSLKGLLQSINGTPEFSKGSGRAYGLEFGVRRRGDRFNFEVNYALSYAGREFDGVQYYTSFDQRHNLGVLGQYHLGKNWLLNFRWALATGRPFNAEDVFFVQRRFDPVTGEWYENVFPRVEPVDGDFRQDQNRLRYPIYHRLDISFTKRIQKQGWALLPYIQVVNAYYRRNVLSYVWDHSSDGTLTKDIIPMMPIIPTFGLAVEF
jgi:hypothetical protein